MLVTLGMQVGGRARCGPAPRAGLPGVGDPIPRARPLLVPCHAAPPPSRGPGVLPEGHPAARPGVGRRRAGGPRLGLQIAAPGAAVSDAGPADDDDARAKGVRAAQGHRAAADADGPLRLPDLAGERAPCAPAQRCVATRSLSQSHVLCWRRGSARLCTCDAHPPDRPASCRGSIPCRPRSPHGRRAASRRTRRRSGALA